MADSWWRFSNTAPDHPKIVVLTDAQFRAWTIFNCLASKMGGEFPEDMAIITAALRKPAGKARELLQVLLSARLLDRTDFGFRPHNWNERQFKSDTSTDRVKRHRERKRNADDETFHTPHDETDHRQSQKQKQKEKINARMARFQAFWDSCPKKTGRGAAEKAWIKALDDADPEQIIQQMQRYAESQVGKDPAYIKTPGPWLNEKRYADEGTAQPQQFEPASENGWRNRLNTWRQGNGWSPKWGPDPSKNDCKCPPEILNEKDAA